MDSCLLIAGEKSGEEHAMTFFPMLKKLSPQTQFYGVGGEELKEQGMELIYHLKDFSSMGFSEVVQKIPFYFGALKRLEREVEERQTKTAIVVDFQDFNLRLAQRLAKKGVKVLYYVAPQAWAWKAHRSKALSRSVHTLFTILPFEKGWFNERGVKQVRAIPHPLMLTYQDEFKHLPEKPWGIWGKKIKILCLPGSRRAEVQGLLPEFVKTLVELRKTYEIEAHLVKVDHLNPALYDHYKEHFDVIYHSTGLTKAMEACHLAIAASGTVTLSTGLFELPTVVCYKASLLNEFIFYNFIKYKGPISLVNIIHGKSVFPELLQDSASAHNISQHLKLWIENEVVYTEIKSTLKKTKELLSGDDFSIPEYMAQVIHE
jgi:lipid-A-disaccharide synthase